jgi:hypothetical protein
MGYLSRPWVFVDLRDEVGPIRRFLPGAAEGLSLGFIILEERLGGVLVGRWAFVAILGEV